MESEEEVETWQEEEQPMVSTDSHERRKAKPTQKRKVAKDDDQVEEPAQKRVAQPPRVIKPKTLVLAPKRRPRQPAEPEAEARTSSWRAPQEPGHEENVKDTEHPAAQNAKVT